MSYIEDGGQHKVLFDNQFDPIPLQEAIINGKKTEIELQETGTLTTVPFNRPINFELPFKVDKIGLLKEIHQLFEKDFKENCLSQANEHLYATSTIIDLILKHKLKIQFINPEGKLDNLEGFISPISSDTIVKAPLLHRR